MGCVYFDTHLIIRLAATSSTTEAPTEAPPKQIFKSTLKIAQEFTADLRNTNSATFQTLASQVKENLLPAIKKNVAGVEDIEVTGFSNGSIVADYNIIMSAGATPVNTSTMQTAVIKTITTGTFTTLAVDTTYRPVVQG